MAERELNRSERAAIRKLVTELCANYDSQDMIAFLISPYGLPLAAAWLVGIIGGANSALRDFIFG